MFKLPENPTGEAYENIDMAAKLQDEAKTIFEEVISTLASGFVNDQVKSQQLQNAFQAMSRLTRSTEMLGIAGLQIRRDVVAKMPSSYPSHYKGHKLCI